MPLAPTPSAFASRARRLVPPSSSNRVCRGVGPRPPQHPRGDQRGAAATRPAARRPPPLAGRGNCRPPPLGRCTSDDDHAHRHPPRERGARRAHLAQVGGRPRAR
eukprot:95947-Prymnesium_polylepis.2